MSHGPLKIFCTYKIGQNIPNVMSKSNYEKKGMVNEGLKTT